MKREYSFFDGGKIVFDDEKSVRELIAFAFDTFGYYEPMGMGVVTLFQAHHPDTNTGWITTDTALPCRDEIKNPDELCFAYHMPGVFYFAEGGWGHHMPHLGNHPHIDNAVSLTLRFEDFDNTVVINGSYTFRDVLRTLQRTEYIDSDCSRIRVGLIGCPDGNYTIYFSDPILDRPLTDFMDIIEKRNQEIKIQFGQFIYGTIFDIL